MCGGENKKYRRSDIECRFTRCPVAIWSVCCSLVKVVCVVRSFYACAKPPDVRSPRSDEYIKRWKPPGRCGERSEADFATSFCKLAMEPLLAQMLNRNPSPAITQNRCWRFVVFTFVYFSFLIALLSSKDFICVIATLLS